MFLAWNSFGNCGETQSEPRSLVERRKNSFAVRNRAGTQSMYHSDVESCVEETLQRIGRRILLGTPLGLGKANHLVNDFFRRARENPHIELRIFTALTLGRPHCKSELERRLVEPLAERLF